MLLIRLSGNGTIPVSAVDTGPSVMTARDASYLRHQQSEACLLQAVQAESAAAQAVHALMSGAVHHRLSR